MLNGEKLKGVTMRQAQGVALVLRTSSMLVGFTKAGDLAGENEIKRAGCWLPARI